MADTPVEQVSEEQAMLDAVDPKKPIMDVKVYAPFQVFFEGKAFSLSATNEVGPFDILPHHHNFICMLVPGKVVVQPVEGEKKVIKVSRALMHVKADRVVVFMDV